MIRTTIAIAAAIALAVALPANSAQAQAARTFVSAAGSDTNNCVNVATPCRHFAAAYAATAAEGEIDVLDPANYGALTISQGISIQGHGWASVSAASGGAAITINGGDKINISGVILDGGAAANSTGIQVNGSGSTLSVRDSVIRNFTNSGIVFQPNSSTLSQLFVSNTAISDNGTVGIFIRAFGSGSTNGVLNHVEMENNGTHGLMTQGPQNMNITVSDSVSANNGASGIVANPEMVAQTILVRNSTIGYNRQDGLVADNSSAVILVTRSTIIGNINGWTANLGGAVVSYGDNNIDGNTNVNTEPPNPLTYK